MTADSYPLPRIWDHLRAAAGRQHFTTLDMNSGFWSVPIAEESKHLTAFITPFGLFEFHVIPFGIKNSPAGFQRAMDMVFEEVLDDRTLCYIDDIIIATDTVPGVMQRLEKVLRLCRERGFYLRLDKSEWLKPEVKYLGHKIGRQGIACQGRKIGNVLNAPAPTSRKELQSFLGAVGYLRPFIPRFAEYTAPLFELLKKGRLFVWSDARGEAFMRLKQAVAGASLLHKPVPGAPLVIETDASEVGIGAVLKQVQKGREVPLEFASKKFTDAERKWDTRERELFAVKWAVEKWCDYVELHHFTVRTDHANLRYLVGVDKGKVFRWALALSRFNFTLEFLSGEKNNMADWLSRYAAEDEECDAEIEAMALGGRVIGHVGQLLGRHQVSEEDFMREYRQLEPQGVPGVKKDGKWWRQAVTGRVYVPERLRARVVLNFHYGTSGHAGVLKTRKRVAGMFYWPGLAEDVAKVVRECLICARTRTRARLAHNVPKGSLENPSAMDTVSLDHVGPMQLDGQSWWLLVVMDHATRYMGAWITSTVTAAQTAHIFLRGWVTPFGIPRVVLTDNGTSFRGAFHEMVAGALGCVHLTTATYRPQGNGINEASHKALRSGFKALWQEGHRDLGRMVAAVCRTHNTTPHISTGVTPYEALFGRPPYFARLPAQ